MVDIEQKSDAPQGRLPTTPRAASESGLGVLDVRVHLLDYWHAIRLRLPLFIAVFAVVVVGVTVYSLVVTPIYRAKSRLLIEPSSVKVTRSEGVYDPTEGSRDFQARRDYLQTQMELIRSDHLMAKAFAQFEFATRKEFLGTVEPLKAFRKRVLVMPTRNTYLVDVTFDWKDPNLAAEVANFLAEAYVSDYQDRQLRLSGRGVASLRQDLAAMEKARKQTSDALVAFKKEHRLIDLDDARKLLVDRMSRLNEASIDADVDEMSTRAALDSLAEWEKGGGDPARIPEVLTNQSIAAFKLERLRAQTQVLDLLNKYGKTHPTVETQERIAKAMEEAVQGEARNSVDSVKLLHNRAQCRSRLLADAMQALEAQTFKIDEWSAEYRMLEDTWKATEESSRTIINRINEVNVSKSTGELAAGGNIIIIDPAKPPRTRITPRRARNVALAVLAGLVLAAGLCLFLDYLDPSIKSKEELEQVLGDVSVLGFVPRLSSAAEEIESALSPRGLVAESFRTIRTSLGLSFAGRQKRAFLVTSPDSGDGKTLTAFNLAVAFARDSKRVLLMECDMRRPRMRKMLEGVQLALPADEAGLSKVLVQAAELPDVVCRYPGLESLDIAFCGAIPPNPAELLGCQRFQDVMKQAVAEYDMVIIDSPPVLSVADCSILAGLGLPVVFLVRAFKTDRHRAALAAEQIRNVQGTIVGGVINSSEAPHHGYYYGGYHYGGRSNYYHAAEADNPGTEAPPNSRES